MLSGAFFCSRNTVNVRAQNSDGTFYGYKFRHVAASFSSKGKDEKERQIMGSNSQKSKGSAELPELLTAQEAAEFLHLSPITLSHYRYQGRGPIYRKHGWRVYYTKADLVDWSEGQRWVSTGEPLR
jgi:hypothetical protein